MIRQSIHLCFLVIAMILITYYTNENDNVKGQEQQPTSIMDNLETMIKQIERIIKQNDETATMLQILYRLFPLRNQEV